MNDVKIGVMRVGYRVVKPEEVGRWDGDIIQISVYKGRGEAVERVRRCAGACRDKGLPYVVHPVGYSLVEPADLGELVEMARLSDEALILHDEVAPDGGRLMGRDDELFRRNMERLMGHARLSFENATNTGDAPWFWDRYADSVTLDMGHMESAGIDSVEFVSRLSDGIVGRVRYVHMHRNGELRGGLTDHWPLRAGCRELKALEALLGRKRDVAAILEINEREETAESVRLLRELAGRAG